MTLYQLNLRYFITNSSNYTINNCLCSRLTKGSTKSNARGRGKNRVRGKDVTNRQAKRKNFYLISNVDDSRLRIQTSRDERVYICCSFATPIYKLLLLSCKPHNATSLLTNKTAIKLVHYSTALEDSGSATRVSRPLSAHACKVPGNRVPTYLYQ
jgi:hypothetical protein